MPNINPDTAQEYYSGTFEDVKMFCKSLNIDEGRLSSVKSTNIEKYQSMVDGAIDGYFAETYFLPIKPYNQVDANGEVHLIFPKRLRLLAQQWTAGLLLTNEMQHQDQNMNEAGQNLIQEAKKEIYQMTLWNHRIPGQRYKSAVSHTLPPNFEPPKAPIEQLWNM